MKLIIQIPCYNEEATLPEIIKDAPRVLEGIDEIRLLVVDDGSTDRTAQVAQEHGVDYIVRHKINSGLAGAFRTGIDACLKLGADIIVTIDGDNQYRCQDIPKLIEPILKGKADIVIGDRRTNDIEWFSSTKKRLHQIGSAVVRSVSQTAISDTVSGFRAITKEAALQLNILSDFSYTIEMVIQAGKKNIAITSIPIDTNPKSREPRLFSSIPEFIRKQMLTIVRTYSMYQPLKVFCYIGTGLCVAGALPVIRFLYAYFTGDGAGHIQSLILGGVLISMGFMTHLVGIASDLISFNRQLIEIILEKVRELELSIKEDSQNHRDEVER